MGLILDSSVLIAAERQGQNAGQMLVAIARTEGNTDIAISVVTLIELAHGAARPDTAERKANRHQFIQELLTGPPIHPVTVPVALRVGRIDGEKRAEGVSFNHAVEMLKRDYFPSACGTEPPPPRKSTTVKLPPLIEHTANDKRLLEAVVEHYHETLKNSPEAQ
ncbi:MAG: PIN domain-containing protein [Candidatus Sulfotelmatobacter sp.]